jgi:CheY-like chemotaxis protein
MDQASGITRILLIDDEQAVLDVTQSMLEWMGYEVTAISSSVEALDLFRRDPKRFDLIITDMVMPYLSGDNLARNIREIRLDMPVILYSGFHESMSDERARALGIKAFVTKPSRMKDLAEAVSWVLDGESAPEGRKINHHKP